MAQDNIEKALRPLIYKLLADLEFHQCRLNSLNSTNAMFCGEMELAFSIWLRDSRLAHFLQKTGFLRKQKIRFIAPRFFNGLLYRDQKIKVLAIRHKTGWKYHLDLCYMTHQSSTSYSIDWQNLFAANS